MVFPLQLGNRQLSQGLKILQLFGWLATFDGCQHSVKEDNKSNRALQSRREIEAHMGGKIDTSILICRISRGARVSEKGFTPRHIVLAIVTSQHSLNQF